MTSLKLDHCSLRNQQSAILRLGGCANAPVTTRTKEIVWISKEAGDANRPGGGINLPIGERDASLVFINFAIGEHQFQGYALSLFFQLRLGRNRRWEMGDFLSAHVQ